MHEEEIQQLVGHLFRHESGKMAAVLTRLVGFDSIELAEDIVQDTLLQAMSVWRYKGVPDKPSAWLYTVAKRKAIDILRQRKIRLHHQSQLSASLQSEWTLTPTVHQMFLENEIEDSQLRMIFACCHPSIPYESQIALTLKTLCGLSTNEIAHSFLASEETISKRIYRAKERIREEKISLDSPPPVTIPGRLEAVLRSLYLLFNEGYNSTYSDNIIRHDLCEEAIRLCLLMVNNKLTDLPDTNALLSLMCFQASRYEARIGDDGRIILLKDQDRLKWNIRLIERGKFYLERASDSNRLSEYHLEAAIAACHADAPSFEKTDWLCILKLYDTLSGIRPSPIVEMNKAIALGYAKSFADGLSALKKIRGLEQHHLYHSAVGDFLMMIGEPLNAIVSFSKAIHLTSSLAEKKLLEKKISQASNKVAAS